ncbi:MAG: thiamine pyrophosphate-dependent enzyme [Candidatus Nealsonbacteria bacterium]
MKSQYFGTKEENTWCPGCPNFGILRAFKNALADLVNEKKIKAKNVVIASGIGCHAKIFDYLNVNGFYGLHGRVLPLCFGMKIANPELTVIGFGGDGDTYAEGISHFVHNCRYNADITMLVHNNKVFALTTGQATPTSEKGFVGRSTPLGVKDKPLNPIASAIVNGATFVARGSALNTNHLKELIREAIKHKGFSFIDILQPCLTFNNFSPYLQKHIYKLDKNHKVTDFRQAFRKSMEWDYSFKEKAKIPIGIFYKIKKPTFGEQWPQLKKPWYKVKRKINFKKTVEEFK